MAKTKTRPRAPKTIAPPKNVGGRPRKDPNEKARRVTFWVPGPEFHALLSRALHMKVRPQRAPNKGRGRSPVEEQDAIVAAYSKERLLELAARILGGPS